MSDWFPAQKQELLGMLDSFLSSTPKVNMNIKDRAIHGLIVPHAGYAYSGEIAGKGFSLLKDKNIKKAIIFGPSHYKSFRGIASLEKFETPLGEIKIPSNNTLPKLPNEHSVENQIPFLQKLNIKEILPIVVGQINWKEAEEIAKQFLKENGDTIFIFSTDLSHFLKYDEAKEKDFSTIDIITNLKESEFQNIDACGFYPLLILFQMCKIKSWKPVLIEYRNSGDITGDKASVVGYSALAF
jgi:AmmeMemoRadiSam system protein B